MRTNSKICTPIVYPWSVAKGRYIMVYWEGSRGELVPQRDRNPVVTVNAL